MASLRDVRLRMRAIRQTLQVTRAMNLISTAKLRKGRRMREDTEPYFERIQKSMFDIISGVNKLHSQFFRKPGDGTRAYTAIIAVTSDKGLAGGYNANVFRQVNELCTKVHNPVLILIGAIGNRYFEHTPYVVLENYTFHSQLPTMESAGEIADFIISQFLWEMFDEVHVVYTHMYSTIKLLPVKLQLLPLDTEKLRAELSNLETKKREELQFEFLPSEEVLFDTLVPLYIRGILYGCMVESYASEQSARMAAMDEASKNAEEMLASLQVSYNRARQAGITQEMSEIVGGSAALSEQ